MSPRPRLDLADERTRRLLAAQAALQHRAYRARASYDAYAEMTLRDEKGQAFELGSIHRVWRAHIDACWAAGLHAGILAPWAHGKTSQIVVGRPTWEVGRDVNLRCKIVDGSVKNARAGFAAGDGDEQLAAAIAQAMGSAQALRDLMKHFDRVLPSVRQLGWSHPATERTLRNRPPDERSIHISCAASSTAIA